MKKPLPPKLQQAIEQAYAAMLGHPQYALLPVHRLAIYEALGPLTDPWTPVDPLNDLEKHRAHLALDLLTAWWILPFWQNERPDDVWPQHLLGIAEGVLNRTVSPEVACQEIDAADAKLDKVLESRRGNEAGNGFEVSHASGVSSSAWFACAAAVETLYDACGYYRFHGHILAISAQNTDADVDPWSSDVAKWAVTAYAGGVWDPESNLAKRKEFWEWWLKEAVPEAWRVGQVEQ